MYIKKNLVLLVSIFILSIIIPSCDLFQLLSFDDWVKVNEEVRDNEYSYTVTFDSQGADTSADPSTIIVKYPATTVVNLPTEPWKDLKYFSGWWTYPYGGGIEFRESTPVTEDITVYAKWSDTQVHRVVFHPNGGTVTPDSYYVDDGQKIINPPKPTRDGYSFDGWFRDEAFTNIWNFDTDVVHGYTDLYAKWTQNSGGSFTVVFHPNGGIVTTTTMTVPSGEKILNPPTPTKDEYTFDGWFKDETLSEIWRFEIDIVTKNTDLYARWSQNSVGLFTVQFHPNGGTVTNEFFTVESGSTITTVPTATRDGYTFDKWFKDETLTMIWDFLADKVYDDIILYARWIPDTNTVFVSAQIGDDSYDGTKASPFKTIQRGIFEVEQNMLNYSFSYGEVLVASGDYASGGSAGVIYIGNPISIRGGFDESFMNFNMRSNITAAVDSSNVTLVSLNNTDSANSCDFTGFNVEGGNITEDTYYSLVDISGNVNFSNNEVKASSVTNGSSNATSIAVYIASTDMSPIIQNNYITLGSYSSPPISGGLYGIVNYESNPEISYNTIKTVLSANFSQGNICGIHSINYNTSASIPVNYKGNTIELISVNSDASNFLTVTGIHIETDDNDPGKIFDISGNKIALKTEGDNNFANCIYVNSQGNFRIYNNVIQLISDAASSYSNYNKGIFLHNDLEGVIRADIINNTFLGRLNSVNTDMSFIYMYNGSEMNSNLLPVYIANNIFTPVPYDMAPATIYGTYYGVYEEAYVQATGITINDIEKNAFFELEVGHSAFHFYSNSDYSLINRNNLSFIPETTRNSSFPFAFKDNIYKSGEAVLVFESVVGFDYLLETVEDNNYNLSSSTYNTILTGAAVGSYFNDPVGWYFTNDIQLFERGMSTSMGAYRY